MKKFVFILLFFIFVQIYPQAKDTKNDPAQTKKENVLRLKGAYNNGKINNGFFNYTKDYDLFFERRYHTDINSKQLSDGYVGLEYYHKLKNGNLVLGVENRNYKTIYTNMSLNYTESSNGRRYVANTFSNNIREFYTNNPIIISNSFEFKQRNTQKLSYTDYYLGYQFIRNKFSFTPKIIQRNLRNDYSAFNLGLPRLASYNTKINNSLRYAGLNIEYKAGNRLTLFADAMVSVSGTSNGNMSTIGMKYTEDYFMSRSSESIVFNPGTINSYTAYYTSIKGVNYTNIELNIEKSKHSLVGSRLMAGFQFAITEDLKFFVSGSRETFKESYKNHYSFTINSTSLRSGTKSDQSTYLDTNYLQKLVVKNFFYAKETITTLNTIHVGFMYDVDFAGIEL